MGQFSMKICPQVGQFLMELNKSCHQPPRDRV
jgi:hypothetical protein